MEISLIHKLCKDGNVEPGLTNYMVDLGDRFIIIKNVPCIKCSQCGETSFELNTVKQIEKIIDTLQKALTEVAIVDYAA